MAKSGKSHKTTVNVVPLDVAVAAFAAKLNLLPQVVTEKLVLDLHSKITLLTPVDTGRARSSWNIQEGTPNTSIPPEVAQAKGENRGKGSPPAIPYAPPAVQITGEKPVFITSSLEYVQYLEEGSSKQAPNGMVAIAILETKADIEAIMAKL